MLPEATLERENGVKGPHKQGAALRTSENNSLRCEGQAQATSRLTGSRAQAIPRHVTSRFGVALCFLNLPNMLVSSPEGGSGDFNESLKWKLTLDFRILMT